MMMAAGRVRARLGCSPAIALSSRFCLPAYVANSVASSVNGGKYKSHVIESLQDDNLSLKDGGAILARKGGGDAKEATAEGEGTTGTVRWHVPAGTVSEADGGRGPGEPLACGPAAHHPGGEPCAPGSTQGRRTC